MVGLVAAMLLALGAPAASAADAATTNLDLPCVGTGCYQLQCTYASAQPSFTGWATINPRACRITMDMIVSVSAWRWRGSTYGWTPASLTPGTRVYVYPYGGGWSWVWTAETGWLATRSDNVLIFRRSPDYCFDCTVAL